MRAPWRFIVALPLGFMLGICVLVACLYSQLGVPTLLSLWTYDIAQKQEQIAAGIPGQRLFIVGGSNALFGLNAALIGQETGIPTVNLSTNSDLFLDYNLYRLKRIVRPGDTVLFAWEYEFCLSGFLYSPEFNDDYVLARDPAYFDQMPALDKVSMATRLPFFRLIEGWRNRHVPLQVLAPKPPYSPYTPISSGIDCLDDHGDQTFNVEATRAPIGPKLTYLCRPLAEGISWKSAFGFHTLADFLAWARDHHVTVLATFPNIVHQSAYDGRNAHATIETITRFYQSHGVPVIGTAQEAMLPMDQFYDTIYHLTHDAALKRTQRLIPELKPFLPNSR